MSKVLIVDDEEFTVDMLTTFLGMNGYETVGAYNGEDALVLAQIESPDILILDLMLPDLEGYDVCRRLRDFEPTSKLPVLILSARTAQVDKDKALLAGADGYLTKPVQFPLLLVELTRLLNRPRPSTTKSTEGAPDVVKPETGTPTPPAATVPPATPSTPVDSSTLPIS